MCREIDAHEVAFLVQLFDIAPALRLGNGGGGHLHLVESEERVGRLLLLKLVVLTEPDEHVEEDLAFGRKRHVALARDAEAVESAAEHQAFECLAVHIAQIDALHHFEHILEGPVFLAFHENGVGRRGTHALDGGQSEAYLTMLVHTELSAALIDIGSEGGDAHRSALIHQFGDFGDIVEVAAHHGGHVLGRVMGLEIGCLVRYP